MNPFARILAWLKPAPKTPEELEADQEAARLRAEMETIKDSALGSAAGMYQSQRGSGHSD
jgi:hypothetical protein